MKRTPNILLLQAEDIGRHLSCYGDPCGHTPYLDAFAQESVRYTNGFTHAPVCAPSRGGMGTGRYPYSLGNHHMRSSLAEPPRHFVQELKDSGYAVHWSTKLDFNFTPQEGWRDSEKPWHLGSAPTEPFLLYENFGTTHESTMFPKGKETPEEARDFHRHRPEDMLPPPWLTDCPELRNQLVAYYNSMSMIDLQIGNRLKWLEEQGIADNTIVVFLSDHGRGLPREKRWCYDAGVHLPLMVRWPGQLEPGTVSDQMVAWVDIAPTLLSLAGAPIPEDYQGQVFLGPEKAPEREVCYGGRDRMDEVFDCVRYVRDKQWHYIRNFAPQLPWAQNQKYMEQQEIMGVMRAKWKEGSLTPAEQTFFKDHKPAEELYDAVADPDCMHNLAEDPGMTDVLERMRGLLDHHRKEVNDLAGITEEKLIAQGVLTNQIPTYKDRYVPMQEDLRLFPEPMPLTLKEARERNAVDPALSLGF